MWTTTADAIADLRALISDGDTDKICDQKAVFGDLNGTNVLFKTFERRRVTSFTSAISAGSPIGVYLNGTRLDPSTEIASDDFSASGSFYLVSAPVDGDKLRATYFYRWFLDTELTSFLVNATQWLGLGVDPTKTPDGLIPASLHYAAQQCYDKLALWFSVKASVAFLLEDVPDASNQGVVDSYNKLSEKFDKKSHALRDDFYTRQGQSLSPRFVSLAGRVREITPRR